MRLTEDNEHYRRIHYTEPCAIITHHLKRPEMAVDRFQSYPFELEARGHTLALLKRDVRWRWRWLHRCNKTPPKWMLRRAFDLIEQWPDSTCSPENSSPFA